MPGFLHIVLGSRPASLMLDVVFIAMFLTVPALAWSINLAKKGKYQAHKTAQLVLAGVLLTAVAAFEVDMQLFTELKPLIAASPHYENGWVTRALIVHLCFAIPTPILWIAVTVLALKHFPSPPLPNKHSRTHKRLGMMAAYGMTLTAATGIVFYYLAFVT